MIIEAECDFKSLEQYQSTQGYIRDEEMMTKRIKTLSRGLAEIAPKSHTVQFIHGSVKEFFVEKGLFALSSRMSSTDLAVGESHSRLSRICLRYLGLKEIAESPKRYSDDRSAKRIRLNQKRNLFLDFTFLEYAVNSWITHTRQSEVNGFPQEELFEYFSWPLETLIQLWEHLDAIISTYHHRRKLKLVHVISKFGLPGP